MKLPNGNEKKEEMSTIHLRYPEKSTLEAEAKAQGHPTLSHYLKWILDNRKPGQKTLPQPAEISQDRRNIGVKTRLTKAEKQALQRHAQAEGESESFILLRQIRALLAQGPTFTQAELKALQTATFQLTGIGRNLNQVAKQMNAGHLETLHFTDRYLLQLQQAVEEQGKHLRALVKKSRSRGIE